MVNSKPGRKQRGIMETTTTEEAGNPRPPVWGIESCDRCGPSVRAKYVAHMEMDEEILLLTLCSHHAGTHIEQLQLDGWKVEIIE